MTQTKLNLNKLIFILNLTLFFILVGIIGYLILYKSTIINTTGLYKVIKVIDGDTIQVEINNRIETIRLIGIDTPEIFPKKECFGEEAFQKTRTLLEGQKVYLLPDPFSSDKDKYNRSLRYVFLPNGRFINAELIKEGYAFNYIYEPFQFMKYFDYLEKKAKESRLGLWSDKCNYYFEIKK